MPPSAAYPPISALRRLITELDQANSQPPVLSALDVQSYPQPLGACHVLNVGEIKDSSFVLSQSRSDGKGYISVAGERRATAASAKTWPRTPSGRTKKLVALHRWITAATRQQHRDGLLPLLRPPARTNVTPAHSAHYYNHNCLLGRN